MNGWVVGPSPLYVSELVSPATRERAGGWVIITRVYKNNDMYYTRSSTVIRNMLNDYPNIITITLIWMGRWAITMYMYGWVEGLLPLPPYKYEWVGGPSLTYVYGLLVGGKVVTTIAMNDGMGGAILGLFYINEWKGG